jgi:hypothetical protein
MRTASWVIREIATGRVIAETFNAATVAGLNTARYEAVPILEYLGALNRQIAGDRTDTERNA